MIKSTMASSSVMSRIDIPAFSKRSERLAKFSGAVVSKPNKTVPKFRADFFKYSKRETSSSSFGTSTTVQPPHQ